MILNESIASENHPLGVLARHIAEEIEAANSRLAGGKSAGSDELARSVAEFASRHYTGHIIPSEYLLILTCRALWATGNELAARKLLRTKGRKFDLSESYADAIFNDDLFACLSGNIGFARGLHSSVFSVLSRSGPYWILNMRVFFSLLGSSLELAVWRVLHALFRQLGVLWDVSGGRGTLGLKELSFVPMSVLGIQRRSKEEKKIVKEIICYCEQDLKMAASERGWRSTPVVISLDQ